MSSIPGPGGPPQPNPYQQPSAQPPQAPVQDNPYAQQAAPPPFPQQMPPGVPPGYGPQPPVPTPAPRKGVPGWVWGIGGVVVASAAWAGTLFATGNLWASGDFGGHAYEKDLCSVAQVSSFEDRYEKGTDKTDKTDYTSQRPSVDQSYCSLNLKSKDAAADDYSSTYISFNATWHKSTDPTDEYADLAKSNEDYKYEGSKTVVKSLSGLGDEAYLTTETGESDDEVNRMVVNVRYGWFTFNMSWSDYSSSSSGDSKVPSAEEVEKWLVADTKATLEKLR